MTTSPPPKKKSAHRQKQERIILEALAEVVRREGVHTFSVQQVADEAGLSHRTLYRYYPTREDLLEGLITYYEEDIRFYDEEKGPKTLEDLVSHIATIFERFERYPNESSVGAIGALVMNRQFNVRARRDEQILQFAEEELGSQSTVSARETGAIVRYLASSLSWIVLRQQLGLSDEETVNAVQWALKTLIAEIKHPTPQTQSANED